MASSNVASVQPGTDINKKKPFNWQRGVWWLGDRIITSGVAHSPALKSRDTNVWTQRRLEKGIVSEMTAMKTISNLNCVNSLVLINRINWKMKCMCVRVGERGREREKGKSEERVGYR